MSHTARRFSLTLLSLSLSFRKKTRVVRLFDRDKERRYPKERTSSSEKKKRKRKSLVVVVVVVVVAEKDRNE
jgi:hypothetical protein